MYSTLFTRTNYTIKASDILNANIYEYDMKSAGMNILYSKNLINDTVYEYLCSLGKYERNVQVGYLQKDNKELKKYLRDGFKEYREKFFKANNIQNEDIVSVKNDAIFILRPVTELKFDTVEFSLKNIYTSFYKINSSMELFYNSKINKIDIKGINSKTLKENGYYEIFKEHDNYILKDLKKLFKLRELDIVKAKTSLIKFMVKYKNRELHYGYYRKLHREPLYDTEFKSIMGRISLKVFDSDFNIDISYNYTILCKLLEIFMGD